MSALARVTVPWMPLVVQLAVAGAPPKTITDEADVPPYTLPDPLVCEDGTRVSEPRVWWEKRRPELLQLFEREEYGRTVLGWPAEVRFVVREEKPDARGGQATRLRVAVLFEGREDGRQMELLLYLPNAVTGPVPVFLGVGPESRPGPGLPGDEPARRRSARGRARLQPTG